MSKFRFLGNSRKTCNDPTIGRQVYDYYNGALEKDDVQVFERHLIQCSHCERIVLELDAAMAALDDQEDFGALIESETAKRQLFAFWLNKKSRH